MQDPYTNTPLPPAPEATSEEQPRQRSPDQRRTLMLWATIAAVGAVLIVLLSCALLVLLLDPDFANNFFN